MACLQPNLDSSEDNHYDIVGMVELEYRNPPGSNCAIEVRKCLDYLEQAMP